MVKCNKCEIKKEEEEFYWAVKDIRRMTYCKKCRITQKKEYAQTEDGKATQKKAQAKYNKTDKGRAFKKKRKAKYDKTDKGIATITRAGATRRAKELSEPNTLTPEQWEQINDKQDHKCAGCQEPFTEEKPATEDHIISVGKGPGRTEENIQALCKSCNSIKGTHSMQYLLERLKEQNV